MDEFYRGSYLEHVRSLACFQYSKKAKPILILLDRSCSEEA